MEEDENDFDKSIDSKTEMDNITDITQPPNEADESTTIKKPICS